MKRVWTPLPHERLHGDQSVQLDVLTVSDLHSIEHTWRNFVSVSWQNESGNGEPSRDKQAFTGIHGPKQADAELAVRTRTEKFSYRSVDPWAFVRYFLPVPHVCWSSRKQELHSPTSRTVMSDCFGPGVGIIIEIMFLFWMSYFWKNWDTFRFALQ